MADARARREDETIKEWLARLARERHARDQLGSGRAQISDVTQPAVAPLVDIEPTVSEQVEQTISEQPSSQSDMPSLLNVGLEQLDRPRAGVAQLLNQTLSGRGEFDGGFGNWLTSQAGTSEETPPIPEVSNEEYQSNPWLKKMMAQVAGTVPDVIQGVGRGLHATGLPGFLQEGWTGEPATPELGVSSQETLGGKEWWAEHLGLRGDKKGEYASWFSDKTKKQKGSFPYWPWKDSEDLPEVEIKLDIAKANPAFRPQTTKDKADGKSQVSQRTGSTPSVMENSKANLMMQMFGKTDMESKGIEDIMRKAEPDYNMALMIGMLNGKGVGPANKFMNSVLQGAALEYRMSKDQQDRAFQIMTAKPTTYYFHDAAAGIEPINLYAWDDVPKGYTNQRPNLTRQQMDRKQYQEILDEYPDNREAGFDAAIDALIANEGAMFTAYDARYGEDPQIARYAKERAAAIIVSGWFNPGGGVHLTRQERKEFAEAWKAGKFEEIKRLIRDKNNGWPMDYDELVRAMFGS